MGGIGSVGGWIGKIGTPYFWEKLNWGGFQNGGFPTFLGKGPDCVADPFGTVPRRRC